MRRYLIAANWKMNKDLENGSSLLTNVKQSIESKNILSKVDVVLCPPFILLEQAKTILNASSISLGAQNIHYQSDGAYTGEISGSMLRSVGCNYVIVGHSERRTYFGETDSIINKKALRALEYHLRPIICVGETLVQRESAATMIVIESQVRGVLEGLEHNQMKNIVIAYEPVWAIGTGRNATPEQAQEVHRCIRNLVSKLYNNEIAQSLLIQYGGSMKADNAHELLKQPDVDGGLIGGASLVAEQFVGILEAAYLLS